MTIGQVMETVHKSLGMAAFSVFLPFLADVEVMGKGNLLPARLFFSFKGQVPPLRAQKVLPKQLFVLKSHGTILPFTVCF